MHKISNMLKTWYLYKKDKQIITKERKVTNRKLYVSVYSEMCNKGYFKATMPAKTWLLLTLTQSGPFASLSLYIRHHMSDLSSQINWQADKRRAVWARRMLGWAWLFKYISQTTCWKKNQINIVVVGNP